MNSRPVAQSLELRPASMQDSERLLSWRNDPDTIRFSRSGRRVRLAEHRAWLARKLADPMTRIWIGEAKGQPVGQVRIEAADEGDCAEVHLVVDPRVRGLGYGSALLRALQAIVCDAGLARRLVARVEASNHASLRTFAANGFHHAGDSGRFMELRWSA